MKPSQKLSFLQLTLSVLCGLAMAVHRNTGPSGAAQAIVAAVAVVTLILCGWFASRLQEKKAWAAAQPDKLHFGLLATAGFLYLASGAVFLYLASTAGFAFQQQTSALLRMIYLLFVGFCGVACGAATLARLSSRDQSKTAGVCAIVPVFFHSLLLLVLYRNNADNPTLSQFGYEIVVFAAALLGAYGACGGRFENKRRIFHKIFCSLGLAFVTQELLTALLQPEAFFAVPGLSLGVLLVLPACWMLLASGLLYHRNFERDLVEAPQPESSDKERSAEETSSHLSSDQ